MPAITQGANSQKGSITQEYSGRSTSKLLSEMKTVLADVYDRFDNSPIFKWQWAIIDVAIIAVFLLR